ncbi:MAG TPA: Zn-dependent hydrolase [Thermoanaerobaculia bacterium]|nr:Zn-dependent hydrolase [Thermoanaerobaculia bacterium]
MPDHLHPRRPEPRALRAWLVSAAGAAVLAATAWFLPDAVAGRMASAAAAAPSAASAPPAASAAARAPAVALPAPADLAPGLEQRLAKWKPVAMPWQSAGLSARERQLIEKLVEACRLLESIYWRQSDPQALALYKALATVAPGAPGMAGVSAAPGAPGAPEPPRSSGAAGSAAAPHVAALQALRRLLWINGSRYDLVDENRPLVGKEPAPPGRALYPAGATRQEIDAYIAAHPAARNAIYDEHAVLRREGGKLVAVPYHVAYREFLVPAARALREAAALSGDPAFANFLRLRATALLDDDYYASDLAWLDLSNPKFDVIFAPYEVYLDDLLGVKTSYGAAVLIRNEAESAKLGVFQKYVPDLQDALPLMPPDRPSKRGRVAPMEVMDSPFRAGDLRHGYQAVADNLPNDPRVHERKGSKRIFFKNFMDARVHDVILPVAKRLMRPDQAAKASAGGYLAAVMMHEISHGLGPAFARRGGQQVDIRAAIGPAYSGLEEAKADVTGMYGLAWLTEHGALPKQRLEEYYCSYVAGIFRTVRFGTGEAHGRAEMMEFNFLVEQGAIGRDPKSGRYVIDFVKIPGVIATLAREVLQIEATGNRRRAEIWFTKYGAMPPDLRSALAAAADVPVDLDPHGSFDEEPR